MARVLRAQNRAFTELGWLFGLCILLHPRKKDAHLPLHRPRRKIRPRPISGHKKAPRLPILKPARTLRQNHANILPANLLRNPPKHPIPGAAGIHKQIPAIRVPKRAGPRAERKNRAKIRKKQANCQKNQRKIPEYPAGFEQHAQKTEVSQSFFGQKGEEGNEIE